MTIITDGYPEGADYFKHVFNALSPASIKLHLTLSGYPGPDISGRFTYAELGAGFGVSIAGWAAQYPNGTFHAIDFNRNHTAWTEQLALKTGLSNLHVHGTSIGDALSLDLPQFDFIVAHGLYSWVNDQVREETRAFIKNHLKPGGCVFLSYNAMPGFKDVEPMRHIILQEVQKHGPAGIASGIRQLEELRKAGAAYFVASPQAVTRLERWQSDSPAYLAAELLSGSHRAYHIHEICQELQGLHWAAWAGMIDYLAACTMPPKVSSLVQGLPTLQAETLRDMFYNTAFRTDIFIKSGEENTAEPQTGLQPDYTSLTECSFSLAWADKPLPASASRLHFKAKLENPLYALVQSALIAAPQTLAQICASVEASPASVLHCLCVLIALDWVHPGPAQAADRERIALFNCSLSDLAAEEIMSPLLSANGGWLTLENQLDQLVILAQLKGEPVEEHLYTVLYADDRSATTPEADARKQIRQYLKESHDRITLFMQRHGLTMFTPLR